MKIITQKELDKKLKLHELWLDDNEQGVKLDLSETYLNGVDLKGADLRYANLKRVSLRDSNLEGANLEHSILIYADLEDVNLTGANLKNAMLMEVDLSGSILNNADLSYAGLNYANLREVDLTDANLIKTDLSGANTTHVRGLKVFSIDNIGTFKGKVTYIPKLDKVFAGCWKGSLEEFLDKGLEMNKGNKVESQNIRLAHQFFKNNKEE